MPQPITLPSAAVPCGTIVLALFTAGAANQRDVANPAPVARTTLRAAIASALAACPGRAVEAEYEESDEEEHGSPAFEVVIVTGSHELFEVRVDPATGRVLAAAKEEDDDAESELASFESALQDAKWSLADLVAKCEEVVKGSAVKAELDDDEPECDVLFASSGCRVEVSIDARDGRLLDLDLEDDEGAEESAKETTAAGPSLTPLADGVAFSSRITHPFLPLSTNRLQELQSKDERVVREVLDETRNVGGVDCLVMAEKEYEDDELAEISYNFFAQDPQGDVWYFGEEVDEYKDGAVVSHGGAWKVGRNAKEPCLFLPAHLEVGFRFEPENSPPEAVEFDEIAQTDAAMEVPAGAFRDVLVVNEGKQPGEIEERKYYARGVGLISENGTLNLVRSGARGRPKRSY